MGGAGGEPIMPTESWHMNDSADAAFRVPAEWLTVQFQVDKE
jgi:hypothetical protein